MSRLLKLVHRRWFIARLLGLATLPVVGKVAATLPAKAQRAQVAEDYPFLGCIIDPIPYGEKDDPSQLG